MTNDAETMRHLFSCANFTWGEFLAAPFCFNMAAVYCAVWLLCGGAYVDDACPALVLRYGWRMACVMGGAGTACRRAYGWRWVARGASEAIGLFYPPRRPAHSRFQKSRGLAPGCRMQNIVHSQSFTSASNRAISTFA